MARDLRSQLLVEPFKHIRGSDSSPVFLRSNPVVQQSRNESLHSVSCTRKSSDLEFVCAFLKSPGIGGRLSEKLCNLLMHFLREFAENRPNEVDRAHLPAGSQE